MTGRAMTSAVFVSRATRRGGRLNGTGNPNPGVGLLAADLVLSVTLKPIAHDATRGRGMMPARALQPGSVCLAEPIPRVGHRERAILLRRQLDPIRFAAMEWRGRRAWPRLWSRRRRDGH